MNFEEDFRIATNVRERALPGSCGYKVGAVLKAKSGKKYTGCNIDNHDIQSICAERVAFVSAMAQGQTDFERIRCISYFSVEKSQDILLREKSSYVTTY